MRIQESQANRNFETVVQGQIYSLDERCVPVDTSELRNRLS